MSIAAWAQRHSRALIFLLILLAAGGAASVFRLPVALFPQVSFPRVRVGVEAGDRPAERMVVEITRPLEEIVRTIPGVRTVRSTSSRGAADIDVDFDWDQDMIAATLQVESLVNRTLPTLPPGTTFEVHRMDPTVFPVIAYSLVSDVRSLTELHDLAQYQLRPALQEVKGVADVSVQGGAIEEYHVIPDMAKLQTFGITLEDVASKVGASNALEAVGRLEDRNKLYLVVTDARFRDIEQIGETVVRAGAGGVIKVRDVATVRRDTEPQFTRVTADGHDAVLLNVFQQPAGNTVQIAEDIHGVFAQQVGHIPAGVRVAKWYDQSDLILASGASVRDALLIGVGLAGVVLILFLRNLRITLVAIITVPIVLAVTVLLLYALHMSFNIMTLGGMAAAVGLIIDDAIVMLEHIMRRVQDVDTGAPERVVLAAGEFVRPLTGSSLSTIIIFAPLAFLSGVTGAFFKALSLTMAAGLIISYFVAWLAIPIVAARVLARRRPRRLEKPNARGPVARVYAGVMRPILRVPWLILLVIVPLVLLGYVAYGRVPSGFMPVMDEGGFILDYVAAPGTSLTETDRLLRQVERILEKHPAVQTYSRRTGLQLGGALTETNTGDFFVQLKPRPREPIDRVMEEVRTEVEQTVPGLEIELLQLMEDLIGDLTGVPQPIEIKLFSSDEKTVLELAPRVAAAIEQIKGVVEVKSGVVLAGDALDIEVDRAAAAVEGVDADMVTKLVQAGLTGNVATSILQGPKLIGVRVWIPREMRATELDVRDMLLRAPDGHLFPLKRVAKLTVITGQPEITRENLRHMVPVTGRIEGRDLGSTIRDVKQTLAKPGLIPQEVTYEFGGLYEQQRIAFQGLLIVMISAIMLVFVLLLFMYERFRVVLAMLLIMLLAVASVFVGLWVTGTELNITSIMGMTMIVGIVTEVSIFYYSEYVDLPHGETSTRLIDAGVNRARAIAMTTIAAILALMTLAVGFGEGSAMLQPLAVAIVAGLAVQIPLVLIVLPGLLALFGEASARA